MAFKGKQPGSGSGEMSRRTQALRPSIALTPAEAGKARSLRRKGEAPADIAAMQTQLAKGALSDDDRLQFHFALGKALEDAGQFEESFKHYAEGNRIRRAGVSYDAAFADHPAYRLPSTLPDVENFSNLLISTPFFSRM